MFKNVYALTLEEAHVLDGQIRRLKILGFNLIDYTGHHKRGLATYVNKKNRRNQQLYVPSNAHFENLEFNPGAFIWLVCLRLARR